MENPTVALDTNHGRIVLELYADQAPKTVRNFLDYVAAGFYDGTLFHRVIPNFMIQGGGFDGQQRQKPAHPPIENEAHNRVANQRGTIAMARTSDPHSATAQFFINLKDNSFLDHTGKTPQGWGYAVFGRVIQGMEVVDRIARVRTAPGRISEAVPAEPVVIKKAEAIRTEG
jgi:peptidyl-prolyl cis-trans isomerase B (cyclophilin B)